MPGTRPIVIAATCLAASGAGCGGPTATVPAGYVFPAWHVGSEGASALLEGTLVDRNGCLYVRPPSGPDDLVIWPDSLHLEVTGGVAVVMAGPTAVASAGGQVRLGGGEIGEAARPAGTARCEGPLWGANTIVPPR